MSAKTFKGGLDSVLGGEPEKKSPGRPKNETGKRKVVSTSQAGVKPGETRASFIVSEQGLEMIKALARYQGKPIKAVLASAIQRELKASKADLAEALKQYRKNNNDKQQLDEFFERTMREAEGLTEEDE